MSSHDPQRNTPALLALLLLAFFLVACRPAPVVTDPPPAVTPTPASRPTRAVETTPTPGVTHLPTDTPDELAQYCCAGYRIGLLGPPVTLNYWAYLGEEASSWTGFVIGDEAPSLYEYPPLRSSRRLDFVPALALDLPPAAEQRAGLWVIPVRMIASATWSDGIPITAQDVVFTIQTVLDLQLGGRWAEFYPAESLVDVTAPDDHTVEFYFVEQPALGEWQFAVAMGPVLPRHFWEEHVAAARAYIEGVAPPETCTGALSEAQQTACQAYAQARQALYAVEPLSPPSAGGYTTTGFTSQNTIRREINPNFYAAGIKISEYADGAWERVFPDGTVQRLYGEAKGKPIVSYRRGPFNRSIEFIIYASSQIAYQALFDGRLDTVLDPSGPGNEWLSRGAIAEGIVQHTSPQNGLVYLAFNLRRQPFSHLELRQALAFLIDQERIAKKDLQNLALPADTIVPAANAFWRNPSPGRAGASLSTAERWDLALQTLRAAGWSWKTDPSWDAASQRIIPGEELRLPGGNPAPPVDLIYPHAEADLLMATYGEIISETLKSLGASVTAESLPRAAVINRVLIAGGSFDLYILDWRLPLYPAYLCDLFYSENDTLLSGGYNTTGYNDPAFDTLCDTFLSQSDPQLAQEQAHLLQEMLAEDQPYLPLFYPLAVDLWRSKVILPYLPDFEGLVGQGGFQTDARVLIE